MTMTTTSMDVITRCLEGDKAALETLILNIQGRIYNLAVRFCGSRWTPKTPPRRF